MQHVLELKTESVGDVDIVQLGGALDTANSDVFTKALQPRAAKGARVVVDCMGLTYVNSMCFALFNKYSKECESNGGKVVFCQVPQKIGQIIHLLGLHNTLHIATTREQAVKMVGG
ncbi:MAG: STAS domain protein [Verrucomicrobia bacterium ADurb.Bin345]|nr:MAG: STAS domain protein [Verrucomicrobia bacterium ADurb.Bin345]